MTDKQRILAEMNLLKQQLLFIETAERMSNPIQEEPVSIDFEQELYKAFGQVKDFTLGMQIAKRFYDMGKNSKESQEHASVWHDAGDVPNDKSKVVVWTGYEMVQCHYMYGKFSELIPTEECGYTINMKCSEGVARVYIPKKKRANLTSIVEKWAYVSELLNLSNVERKAGADWQKEQLMAKAVGVEVKIDAGGYPYIPQIELYDYDKDVPLAKEGDKYKVVLIKENKDE